MSAKVVKQARQLYQQNSSEGAIELLQDVLEDEPDNLAALLVLGACELKLERYQSCVKTFDAARKVDNSNITVWKGLMRAYYSLKDYSNYFEAGKTCLYLYASNPILDKSRDSEAPQLFKTMVSVIMKNARIHKQEAVVDQLLALQVPPISADDVEHAAVFNMLMSFGLAKSDAAKLLIKSRYKQFRQQVSAIDARLKQSLNYNQAKATTDKLAALDSSHLYLLLKYAISIEDQDDIRRSHESLLLQLLVTSLEMNVFLNTNTAEIVNLREEIQDMSDRMVMFEPTEPLCFDLMWDWDMPDLEVPDFGHKRKTQRRRDKKRNKKETLEEKTENLQISDEKASDDKASDDKGSDDKGSDDKISDDRTSDDRTSDDRTSDDKISKFELYTKLFPQSKLSQVLLALGNRELSSRERIKMCREYSGDSVFGWLLCVHVFTTSQNYENALDFAHSGLNAAKRRAKIFDMDMTDCELKFKLDMATCYTYFQAPKNFALASELYDFVLARDPSNSIALVGKGLILSQMGEVDGAIELLSQVCANDRSNKKALNELSWLYGLKGDISKSIAGLKECLVVGNTPTENAEIHWRIGKLLWDSGKRDQTCFDSFVAALAASQTFAPGFTYLGLFYQQILKDDQRAQRCFYRALELDNGELLAGERLANDFANRSQWDLVEIVATNVLSSSKLQGDKDIDWPYRAMGIVCINQLRYDEAVKYFQRCLRSRSKDVQAWVGLGEAYIHSGRYSSAEKALKKALKIDPNDFSAYYVLSLAQREMLNFPGSAESLQTAIEKAPSANAELAWALTDNCLRAASYFYSQSKLEEALVELNRALSAITSSITTVNSTNSTGSFWGLAAEVVLLLSQLGYQHQDEIPEEAMSYMQQLNELSDASSTRILDWAQSYAKQFVAQAVQQSKPLKVSALSLAALTSYKAGKETDAITYYKEAIELESRNEALWIGYGVVLQKRSPRVSQHCFIRALSINGRNTDTWVNLAALYLVNGDPEMALEAADRALALEPDLCRAWVVQALAETVLGSNTDEHIYRTFEHAYLLSENDTVASLALAFKQYELRPEDPSPASLGALDKLLAVSNINDRKSARLVMGLLLERRGDYEEAANHLTAVEAWPHVARVQLAMQEYEAALETCSKVGAESSGMALLSTLVVSGLAHYFLGDLDSSISVFTTALDQFESDPEIGEDVLRMLVEVLYASKSEDALQVAQDQLFMSIEQNGATLQVTMLLGAFGLLSNDEVVKDAARDELRNLITPSLTGEMLGKACRILSLLDPTDMTYQRAVFQWPTDYKLWREADKKQALIIAQGRANPMDLSVTLMDAGGLSNCQRAAFLDPLNEDVMNALRESLPN